MEEPLEIHPEIVLGDPNETGGQPNVIIGRNGDSTQLVITIETPNGAAVVAHFVPEAGLEIVLSTLVLLRSCDILGVSNHANDVLTRLTEDAADDE